MGVRRPSYQKKVIGLPGNRAVSHSFGNHACLKCSIKILPPQCLAILKTPKRTREPCEKQGQTNPSIGGSQLILTVGHDNWESQKQMACHPISLDQCFHAIKTLNFETPFCKLTSVLAFCDFLVCQLTSILQLKPQNARDANTKYLINIL